MLLYHGKAKDYSYQELLLGLMFGRKVERLEDTDFNWN